MTKLTNIIVLLLLSLTSLTQGKSHPYDQPASMPVSMTAVGVHGMALFVGKDNIFASHMPLVNSIHAHQVILAIELSDKNKRATLALSHQYSLLSLLPMRFDLMKLISGQITQFKADLYAGHFERGGKVVLSNITVRVVKLLLAEPIVSNKTTKAKQAYLSRYYLIPLQQDALLVHKIEQLPSFDQILKVSFDSTFAAALATGKRAVIVKQGATPIEPENSLTWPKHIKVIKEYYRELQDFK